MTRAVLLRIGATAATVVSLLASAGYVSGHVKDAAAPLHPPVARPTPSPTPLPAATARLRIAPSVHTTSLPAVTSTRVS